jgi:5-methylcytosine-specific restriction protein A
MIYLFQRIIQNHFQWTRPSPGRLGPYGEGKYVQKNGFGHEDWNFNDSLTINNFIYGYCYYHPNKKKENEKFNIAFATYSNKKWNVVGFYLETEFVQNPPVRNPVINQKISDLLQLGNSLGNRWRMFSPARFRKEMVSEVRWLKWKVKPTNAIRTEQPIIIPKRIFDTHNYRIVKPTEISKPVFDNIFSLAQSSTFDEDYGEVTVFPEGKEIERKHKLRERNQAVVKIAKVQFKRKNGKLFCQVCNFDFFKTYGLRGMDYIEAHHVLPLSKLNNKSVTKVSDIALVCSNCHRMLHRERPWLDMLDLKTILHKRK